MQARMRGLPVEVQRRVRSVHWRRVALLGAMLLSASLVLVGVLAWQLLYGDRLVVATGEVAPLTVVAPQRITYDSAERTARARERAAALVSDQYDSDEERVRREQVAHAREVMTIIGDVRANADATLAERSDQLTAIADLGLSAETAVAVLSLADAEWSEVAQETPAALSRILRDEIRESNLTTIRRRVPSFVSTFLSEPASEVAIVLVQALIRPNSLLNVERTEQLRTEAREKAAVQTVTLEQGEVVIRAGDVATPEQTEALLQLAQRQHEWDPWTLLRALLFAAVVIAVTIAAVYLLKPQVLHDYHQLAMLLMVSVIWLLTAKFMIVSHPLLPFMFPLAALGILISVLCDLRVAIVFVVAFALVVTYLSMGSAPIIAYSLLGALTGILVVGRGERLNSFLWAGFAISAVNLSVLAAFWAPFTEPGAPQLGEMALMSVLNGGLSAAIGLIGYFVLGNLFDITTPLQLVELSRPTHPLLRQLLLKAPGTYHHTILVSNMAERAAAAIGADALLVRVGAYYHDIGKTVRPYFFAENIMDVTSPHEKLDPLTSAQIIISHVKDGVELAQNHHLPDRIQDFIREHHGRSLVRYFYNQAVRQANPDEVVNEEDFRYPGPNPHSKEAAILLLADTCEAAVRAVRPASREELAALVNRLIDERTLSGELDNADLTFRELQMVQNIFLQVLQGVHHPRIVYPEPAKHAPPGEQGVRVATVQLANVRAGQERPAPGGVEETMAPQVAATMAVEG